MCNEHGACDGHLYASYDDVPVDDRPFTTTRRRSPVATRSTITALRQQLAALAEEISRLEARPAEPALGSIIKFNIQFHSGGVNYTYAAIHAGGFWYTTGKADHKRLTWDALLDWLSSHGTEEVELLRPAARGERIKIGG